MPFKPMLAGVAPDSLHDITYPVLVSPKMDGVRCVIIGGKPVSRNLKDIPNTYVNQYLRGSKLCEGLDGELMLHGSNSFNAVQSAVMREDGNPDFVYNVFDCAGVAGGFEERFAAVQDFLEGRRRQEHERHIALTPHFVCQTFQELFAYEEQFLSQGFEGVMIRSMDGPYKQGRSSTKQGYLLKLKRFDDDEALIIGWTELQHNDNVATKDELGHTKRSTHKAGMRPGGTLGTLMLRRRDGVEFECGSGYTQDQRDALWKIRNALIGQRAKYKFQPDPAAPENRPRFPVFIAVRDPRDMDD